MTTSNLDLARECGADVVGNKKINFVALTLAQLDAFAERILAVAQLHGNPGPLGSTSIIQRAIACIESQDLSHWSDDMDRVTLAALRQALATPPYDQAAPSQPSPAAVEKTLVEELAELRKTTPGPTVEPNSQDWASLGGAVAFHLIERHADNWADAELMMGEWLAANQSMAVERKPLPKEEIDGMAEDGVFFGNVYEIVQAIEAAHGITAQQGGEHGL